MAMMSFVAVIGPVVRMLGLSEWHAGLSVTAAGVLWMLAARPWGQLSDRIGRKRVLMLAMSGAAGTGVGAGAGGCTRPDRAVLCGRPAHGRRADR
ncbi:hypothetical protein G6F60_015093 [Rhizopus arrhizus]|nr:hypothetical protein G6F40_017684 [Rhizopus arrhizus]KAG1383019.1 hypothetical protein G6F60_015093 [Rhizopus arrhizus]